jgi:hypothetical protein
MLGRKERAFGLDYCLHPSFFEMKVNCAGREGLVDNIAESIGDLDSIFCLMSGDKMDGMADIRGGKLGWMATSGLL